jgi:hypothetical protein
MINDKLTPAVAKAVIKVAVSAIRHELDAILLPTDVTLAAPDHERDVLGAVLAKRLAHSELHPLHGTHFAIGVYGALWDASRETLEPARLFEAIREEYPWSAATIVEVTPVACEPSPSFSDLVMSGARIRELWARRTLSTAMMSLARMLASETITVPDAIDQLRKVIQGTRAT